MLHMRLSDAGLRFIASWEGYRRWPYNDAAGFATIGYGHLLHYSPVNAWDRARYPFGLSVPAALALLRRDCAAAEAGVNQLVTRPLGQGQFDALVSFAFNCGTGGLAHSTLLVDVNRHLGPKGAPAIRADFERWCHAGGVVLPGLLRRREAEANLYLEGKYLQA